MINPTTEELDWAAGFRSRYQLAPSIDPEGDIARLTERQKKILIFYDSLLRHHSAEDYRLHAMLDIVKNK